MPEPWDGCMECGHDKHPFREGNRDVRCGAQTNFLGDPGDGPEPCECVHWADVLAVYQAIDRNATYWQARADEWMAVACRCGHALGRHHSTAGWCGECRCKHFTISFDTRSYPRRRLTDPRAEGSSPDA